MSAEQTLQTRASDGLRELADWLDAHPTATFVNYEINDFVADREEMVTRARELGGRWEKRENESYFELVRQIGSFTYSIFTSRDVVCERVVVGTREIVHEAVPRRVETVEDVEWRCPESLLSTTLVVQPEDTFDTALGEGRR